MNKYANYEFVEEEPTQQNKQVEGTVPYLVRNLAKAPIGLLSAARSGLGLGNLAEMFVRKYSQQPQAEKEQMLRDLSVLLPTYQQSQQQAQKGLSYLLPEEGAKYLTETRPGDAPAEFVSQQLPFLGYGLAKAGLSGLMSSGAGSLGLLAGSELGRAGGGYIGEQLGDREFGEELGGLTGGYYGIHAGHAAAKRPAKFFREKLYEKNVNEFEQNKNKRIAEIEQEYRPQIEEAAKEAEYEPLRLQKEQTAFEQAKNEAIQQLNNEHKANKDNIISEYKSEVERLNNESKNRKLKIKELEETRHPEYTESKKYRAEIHESAQNLIDISKDVQDRTISGIEPADQTRIRNMANQLEEIGRSKGGASLAQAIETKENLNSYILDRNVPNPVKKYYRELRNSLVDWIAHVGEKFPEHGKPYASAEKKTAEFKNLVEETPEFNKQQTAKRKELDNKFKQDIRNIENQHKEAHNKIKSEKFSPEKEIYSKQEETRLKEQTKTVKKEFEALKKEIGNETYDKLIKSQKEQQKIAEVITELAKEGASKWGIAGLGTILSFLIPGWSAKPIAFFLSKLLNGTFRDSHAVWKMFSEHPDIRADFAKIVRDSVKGDIPKLAFELKRAGDKAKKYTEKDKYSKYEYIG